MSTYLTPDKSKGREPGYIIPYQNVGTEKNTPNMDIISDANIQSGYEQYYSMGLYPLESPVLA